MWVVAGAAAGRLALLKNLCSLLGLFEPLPMLRADIERSDLPDFALPGVRGRDSGDLRPDPCGWMLIIGGGIIFVPEDPLDIPAPGAVLIIPLICVGEVGG